jgi:hypothetical protein
MIAHRGLEQKTYCFKTGVSKGKRFWIAPEGLVSGAFDLEG